MRRCRIFVLASLALGLVTTSAAASSTPPMPGTWRTLAPMPFSIPQANASVWTGGELIVYGRKPSVNPSVDVAAAYRPSTNTWTTLSPPAGPEYVPGYSAVWTGKEMLVFGAFHSVAYVPRSSRWRELRRSVPGGIVVWTGRVAIGWGGGCCGDASGSGVSYRPASDTYRALPRGPLAPSQHPVGAWTGRELVLLVNGVNPASGGQYPARLARAAAYNPGTQRWRRLPPLPVTGGQLGSAVWDGHELLVAGAGPTSRAAFAFDPSTNRWRRLAALPRPRIGAAPLWTGTRFVLWGGQIPSADVPGGLRNGVAYDPRSDAWSSIPQAPLRSSGSAVAWTGRSLLVFGGSIGASRATHNRQIYLRAGAAFTAAR